MDFRGSIHILLLILFFISPLSLQNLFDYDLDTVYWIKGPQEGTMYWGGSMLSIVFCLKTAKPLLPPAESHSRLPYTISLELTTTKSDLAPSNEPVKAVEWHRWTKGQSVDISHTTRSDPFSIYTGEYTFFSPSFMKIKGPMINQDVQLMSIANPHHLRNGRDSDRNEKGPYMMCFKAFGQLPSLRESKRLHFSVMDPHRRLLLGRSPNFQLAPGRQYQKDIIWSDHYDRYMNRQKEGPSSLLL